MTSLIQSLRDVYQAECSALKQKPNSWVLSYLVEQEAKYGSPATISELNFSATLLGRKGVLPLLTVIARCLTLRLLNLNGTGLNDFAVALLAESLTRHPSVCIVFLKGNYVTADSLPALKKLAHAFLHRAVQSSSPLAAVKRRNDETEFEIHVDCGPGIFESAVAELAVIRRTANKADLEAAQTAPQPPSAALPSSESTKTREETDADFHVDKKHSPEFLHTMRRLQRRLQQESHYNARMSRRLRFNNDQWLTLGVYVSCTFSEFPDEAQLLHRVIFPLLNHRLKPFRVHLVPVMLHTMEDEDFRITNTHTADGPMPINQQRLPQWRRGSQQGDTERDGDGTTVWSASSAEVVDLRELAIRDGCDIFLALHSDMFNPSCHVVDWNALETTAEASSIPTFVYRRKVHQVPLGLQHLFDYKANLQFQLAEQSYAIEHGTGPKPKLADQIAERKIRMNDYVLFTRKVNEAVPKFMQHTYNANFANVDANGLARFNLANSFAESVLQDLFCAALAYRQKRLSGFAAPPTLIPLNYAVPTITRHNWTGGSVQQNPFAHLEHKLGLDDPSRSSEAFFVKSIADAVLSSKSQLEHADNDDAPPGVPFQAIFGQRGSGRTTQLRGVGSRIQELKQKSGHLVVTHSVMAGKRTLHGVMAGILRQLVTPGTAVFADWPAFDDDDQLVRAFCDSLRNRCSLIPRFAACLWILIDDDDAVEFGSSFAEAFHSADRRKQLRESVPHEGMHVRVIYTTTIRPQPHEELLVHLVPALDEIEAADMFMHFMLGIETVPDSAMQMVKHAAHYLVLQKKHGLKPLYLYLCAREMLYFNEEMSMVNIAEMLPGTIEELLSVNIRQLMPRDLAPVLDAIALAPAPVDGAFIRHAITAHRREPAFSVIAAKRQWFSKRNWGGFSRPLLSSSALYAVFLVNYLHLFSGCTRSRNRGFLTQRRSNYLGSIWRDELLFLSRTVAETLASRPKERKPTPIAKLTDGVLPQNPWQNVLLRASLLRDEATTLRALCNYFDPARFFSTPHRLFALLQHRRMDDVRLLFERLLLLQCADAAASSSTGSDSKLGIDGPQRIMPHHIRAKLNELRITLQFAANDPNSLLAQKKENPLALLVEYMTYVMENWAVLSRHPTFLYACPQNAPPLIREAVEAALSKEHCSAYLRLDASVSFAKKCFETALLLTSHAQEQQQNASALSSKSKVSNSSMVMSPSMAGDAEGEVASGPRIKSFAKASVVSKSFVVTYRSIADAKAHEITPTMVSPATQLAAEDDANGGQSFGYLAVVLMPPEPSSVTAKDFGLGSRNFAQQTLSKGTFFLSVKAHVNAISCVEIVESRHAIRIASAAYLDPEIAITALVLSASPEASRLQLVGRLMTEHVQRPMFAAIALSPMSKSHVSDNGVDDGQRCPMVAVGVKNMLHVFEGQRFGHDNLYNRKGSIQAQVYSGHDNRIVSYGFSPAGAKLFSIDVSGHCFVWGTPESPCSGTILAVTDFGSVPTFARFVDHETLLVVTNRGITLWNSSNSQVSQLLANPMRQPLDASNYQMIHYQPPSYVYGSLEDTELLQLPPHVKVHRLLEQLREKKHPTVTYMAFDGITFFDASEKQLKVFRRQHVPPQNELECDKPPMILFAKEASQVCPILPQVSTSDVAGNQQVERWQWFLGSRKAVAIDTTEQMVKVFDLLKGQQVPLFFAVKETLQAADATPVFSKLDDAVLAGENEDRLVVLQHDGTVHILTLTNGPLLYPHPPHTTV